MHHRRTIRWAGPLVAAVLAVPLLAGTAYADPALPGTGVEGSAPDTTSTSDVLATATGSDGCADETTQTLSDVSGGTTTAANQELLAPEPPPPAVQIDPDDPGYVRVWGGLTAVMSDCSPETAFTFQQPTDIVVAEGVAVLREADGGGGGGSGVDWKAYGLRSEPSREYDYGGQIGDSSRESWGAHVMLFDTLKPNKNGRLMVWSQKADVSITTNGNWKIMSAVSQLWHHNGANVKVRDTGPLGSQDFEDTGDASVTIGVTAKNDTDSGELNIGWSKEYGVSYTTFGGVNHRWDPDDGHGYRTYGTEGGFLKVAHCHRAQPRAWAQAMALLLPKKTKSVIRTKIYYDIKKRGSDTQC
jgi:hypothetical protein